MGLGSGIRDPRSGIQGLGSGFWEKNLFRIPDPGSKRHRIPDPDHIVVFNGYYAMFIKNFFKIAFFLQSAINEGKCHMRRRGMEIRIFSYSAKCAKSRPWLTKGQIQKTSRYVLSKQDGTE